ncbi:MAG: cupin domain-containing protein [Candidatus Dormibacteraceae bacterium]
MDRGAGDRDRTAIAGTLRRNETLEHAHAAAYVVGPDDGERIQGPAGGPLTFKARGAQTKGQLTIFENFIAPGDGPPLHSHAAEDEYWYVLQGDLRFRLADDLSNAPKGSFVLVPRGTPHCFHNTGDIPAKILVLFTPSGAFLRTIRRPTSRSRPEIGIREHRQRGWYGRPRAAAFYLPPSVAGWVRHASR